jgi:hypothetical protein
MGNDDDNYYGKVATTFGANRPSTSLNHDSADLAILTQVQQQVNTTYKQQKKI